MFFCCSFSHWLDLNAMDYARDHRLYCMPCIAAAAAPTTVATLWMPCCWKGILNIYFFFVRCLLVMITFILLKTIRIARQPHAANMNVNYEHERQSKRIWELKCACSFLVGIIALSLSLSLFHSFSLFLCHVWMAQNEMKTMKPCDSVFRLFLYYVALNEPIQSSVNVAVSRLPPKINGIPYDTYTRWKEGNRKVCW